jgi:hypothetical protein
MNQMKTGIKVRNRIRLFTVCISLTFVAPDCISLFEPDYKGEESDLLVVDGSLIKGFETQVIYISRSSSILQPQYKPLENCHVKIMDDSGNEFVFIEESPGKYIASIDDALLNYNDRYRLIFGTPSGEYYESGLQTLLKSPPVDSIYCFKEVHYFADSSRYIEGLQFYADLNANDDASRYYRWQIVETWELHASRKIEGVYDGEAVRLSTIPSDSLYYCWKTKSATGIYTSSTTALSHNIIKKIPLHFVLGSSPILAIKYGATVRQFALNKDAYDYWHQKEAELNESDNIYTTQPNQNKSNIFNVNNPDEKVLGFFWASSFTEKHLLVKNPFFTNPEGPSSCESIGIATYLCCQELIDYLFTTVRNMKDFPQPPVYIYVVGLVSGQNVYYFTKDECIDCRMMGATNHKPEFWH